MKLKERLQPGLLASETFFPILEEESRLIDMVKLTLEDGFYKRVEISAMKTAAGQRGLCRLAEQIPVTQWITNDLNALNLNPSTVDPQLRSKTIQKMKELVDVAAQSGADRVAIISCKDPGSALRAEAAKGLTEVMCTVADYAKASNITLMLEPLDRGAHKDNFIGPTDEAVAILKKVHESCTNVLISWDAAHVALNGEDVVESLDMAFDYVGHIHFANAILDRGNAAFGDWHMPMGTPGFLTEEVGVKLASCAFHRLGQSKTLNITIESRSANAESMLENDRNNRAFLGRILEREVL